MRIFGPTVQSAVKQTFAYNLKVHNDWNHIYLAGYSLGWT